jgi:hypothetical protein
MTLLVLYSVAAWFSLFWINGILSWQLTPGEWETTRDVWDGFFNASFWPSLLYRTIVSLTIASLVGCVVINTFQDVGAAERGELLTRSSRPLVFMTLMPALGLWYLQAIPPDSRSWVLGGSAAMTLFFAAAISASLFIGVFAIIGVVRRKVYIGGPTAGLLCAAAFAATGAGEFVREGVRKPYSIRNTLYSNSITEAEVAQLRVLGSVTHDPYPLRNDTDYPNDQVKTGAKVYRLQCAVCHTVDGANGLLHLAGTWTLDQKRMNIAKLQHTKPFMPPFAGNAPEVEALTQFISWLDAGRPRSWINSDDPRILLVIQQWLDEAAVGSPIVSVPRPTTESQ